LPRCSAESPYGQKFCGECGAALAVVCSSCGTASPPGQKFCGLALSQVWDAAFEEGRLNALDELQDRFCVCMK
jgi:double zinc ribbon protein